MIQSIEKKNSKEGIYGAIGVAGAIVGGLETFSQLGVDLGVYKKAKDRAWEQRGFNETMGTNSFPSDMLFVKPVNDTSSALYPKEMVAIEKKETASEYYAAGGMTLT
ncbi:hypothetical protein OAC51_03960 [Flavobacteriaceae bacterium]|nr:hypothetical protein [Flavobacteriaceae bacterium]